MISTISRTANKSRDVSARRFQGNTPSRSRERCAPAFQSSPAPRSSVKSPVRSARTFLFPSAELSPVKCHVKFLSRNAARCLARNAGPCLSRSRGRCQDK